jgi:hypothetical protein
VGSRRAYLGRESWSKGHALEFTTWQSLVRTQGLDDEAAVDLLVGLVGCLDRQG